MPRQAARLIIGKGGQPVAAAWLVPGTAGANRPALHINIQVHIDPTSSAEQIDHIFASMARHLYGNES